MTINPLKSPVRGGSSSEHNKQRRGTFS